MIGHRRAAILAAYREGMDCGLLYQPRKGTVSGPCPYTHDGDDYLVAAFWRGVRDTSNMVPLSSAASSRNRACA